MEVRHTPRWVSPHIEEGEPKGFVYMLFSRLGTDDEMCVLFRHRMRWLVWHVHINDDMSRM